jgi:uncharacterized protein (TIGR03437 family)
MRLFPSSLVAVLLMSATPLLAGLATANQDDTHFYLENDVLKIAVLRSTGSLDGIIHKQSSVNLQSNNVNNYPGMWGMFLGTPSGATPFVGSGNAISFSGSITNGSNVASLTLIWKGLQYLPNGMANLPNITVTAQISVRVDSQLSYWTFAASGLGTNSVASITYPYIAGIGKLGASSDDDQLLVPQTKGTIYHNPTVNLTAPTGSFYPSAYASMQMLAYFDATSGFYFASDDTQGYTKDFWWGKSNSPAGDSTINLVSVPAGLPADTVTLPYNMIVGVTQGDWYAPADMYRNWAVQQPWAQQSRTKSVPAWLHDLPLIRNTCAHGCGSQPEQSYSNVIQESQQSQRSLGVASLVELWGWEKYGAWVEGDYLPPQEGWSSFDAMVQGLRPGKLRLLPSALFLDTNTALYQSGTMSSSAMLDQQSKVRTQPGVAVNAGDTWAFMDFSTDPWRQYIVNAYQTLAQHGADLIQLDSSMEAGPQLCYNPAHAHPPGNGGNWQTLAWIDITQRIVKAVGTANAGAAVSAEEPGEIYLPYLSLHHGSAVDQFTDQSQVNTTHQEPVPLFQYVYHDSILFVDWFGPPAGDGSFFRLALARDLMWGQIPDYQIPVGYTPALEPTAEVYLKNAITARTTYAKKFLVDGIMLPPPQLKVPSTTVSWILFSQNNTQETGQYPSIQESAWRASDGSVGIVMTNIAPNGATFSLPIAYSRLGLPAGAAFTVQTTDGSSVTALDSNMVKDSSYSITLATQQIILVLLTPKAVQPRVSSDGVVLHASTSNTVSPGSLFDIYGTNFAPGPMSLPAGAQVLPSVLGTTQVLVNGIPAPLLYAGPSQIVGQVPVSVLTGVASVVVLNAGAASAAASINVQQAAPSILTYGTNRAVVENRDYSVNSSANPATPGSAAVVYLIGSGPVAPALDDGTPAEASPLSKETLPTTVTVGGMPAQVLFAGMAPGFVGLVQVNFQVPDLGAGDYPIQVSIGTTQSNTPLMSVGN